MRRTTFPSRTSTAGMISSIAGLPMLQRAKTVLQFRVSVSARHRTGADMTIPGDNWKKTASEELLEAIVTLETVDEAAAFMRDLCTRKLLEEGIPYRDISDRTGLSTATITRINQWLQHGTGGYRSMLTKLEEAR